MRLPCPFCGLRDVTEFTYEGPADLAWPALDAPEADWVEAVYLREQPKGPARELWRHRHGCRSWLAVTRDNVSHAVLGVELAHPGAAAALAAALGESPAPTPAPRIAEPGTAEEETAEPQAPRLRYASAGGGGGAGGGGAA